MKLEMFLEYILEGSGCYDVYAADLNASLPL